MKNHCPRRKRIEKNKEKKQLVSQIDSDEWHYFIVGYTSGGAAYGITWDEARVMGLLENGGTQSI